jgi:hypothetical protein
MGTWLGRGWRADLNDWRHAMDPRFSALPYSAQVAVAGATKALARAQKALAAKQKIADRADRRSRAAGVTADRLQRNMANVKYGVRS